MSRAIDLVGKLSIEDSRAQRIWVEGSGNQLELNLPSLRAGFMLANQLSRLYGRKPAIDKLQRVLGHTDVTLMVSVVGRRVARLAPASKGSWLASLLGLGSFEVRPLALLRSLLRV